MLENKFERRADQLREDMESASKVEPAGAEAAMSDVVYVIRQMEAAGDLLLTVEEDEED